jgi:hypothetical protein
VPYRITACVVWIAASVIPALLIAAGDIAITTTVANLERDYPIETRVLDNGFEQVAEAEPQRIFVVCTTWARLTECRAVDLFLRSVPGTSN